MFLVIGMLQVSASVYSQGNRVKIKERNIALAELFWKIQSQTDFVFAFSNEDVEAFTNLNVNTEGKIEEVLNEILADKGLSFELKNGVYVIHRKAAERKPIVVEKQQEEKKLKVTGTVRDEKGEPLPFAAVCLKGTTYGCVSAIDGHYVLEAPVEEDLILEVSSLGYKSQEIPVEGRTVIDIVMVTDIENLNEVVVTGYTKVSKVRATSSSVKVTSKSIERQATTNLDDRMEGLATGLNIVAVTRSGGQEHLELVLRGISTFDEEGESRDPAMQTRNSLNRQPLIVVDGFPYEGPFNDIDQETIESIDVLKDAAATALWGLRASNGVIVITTKRGKEGKPRVSFATNWTFGTKQNLNDFGLASSPEQIAVRNKYQELNPTDSRAYAAINYKPSAPSWWNPAWGEYPSEPDYSKKYANLDAFDQIWADFYAGVTNEQQRDDQLIALGQNDVLDQFQKEFLRPGFSMQNSLNINGGSNYINYNFTATHTKEEKPIIGDDFERLSLSLTTDIKLNDKLTTIFDVSLINAEDVFNGIGTDALYTGADQYIPRFASLKKASGKSAKVYDVYQPYKEEFLSLGFDEAGYDPINDLQYQDNSYKTANLRLAAAVNYKITNWLTADVKYQYNRIEGMNRNHRPTDGYYMRSRQNNYIINVDPGDGSGVTRAVPYGDWLEKQRNVTIFTVLRGSLNFNKVFATDHVVSGVVGMEATENDFTSNMQRFVGYSNVTGLYDRTFNHSEWVENGNRIIVDGQTPYLNPSGSFYNDNLYLDNEIGRTISAFSNLSYSYKAKYNIEGSLKLDQATAFGINKRLAVNPYWAISGSWNAAKEEFLKAPWLDVLKLRASYGVNGNMRRGLFTQAVIMYHDYDYLNTRPYAGVESPGNPNLAPEETTTKNFGFDLGLFNRINTSVDIYNKQSRDLLINQQVNSTYGLPPVYSNDGAISNKGIEINIGGDVFRKKDFRWHANLNFTYNKNEVLKYGRRSPTASSAYYADVLTGLTKVIGEDVSTQVRYDWAGLDSNGNPQVYNKDRDVVSFTDPEFKTMTQEDMVTTKPFIAPTFGGLTNVINFKQFTLSAMITCKFGHVFQENLEAKYAAYSNRDNTESKHKDVANAWQQSGDEVNTDIPAFPRDLIELTSFDRKSAFTYSNYGLHDASHIRLKDVTVNYQLSEELIGKVGIRRASLMFQVRDLGLIWSANKVDLDPESVPFSGRQVNYPGSFAKAYRPGIKVPVSFVVGARFEF
ncbi:MAG: SusC/RagA family TonB-linked outer membrane protein [Carboxylicivirga sp.]|nr:SusC/RagA family TonB-linked outer membrane protein [Carboxylicivirga sp.]